MHTPKHRFGRRTAFPVLLALPLLLAACGGGGDAPGGPSGPSGPTNPGPPTLTGIALSRTSMTLTGLGATDSLRATLQPTGASGTPEWSSEDPAIATVSGGASAVVTAVGAGSTRLRARIGTIEASATVLVVPTVRAIALDTAPLDLLVGDSARLLSAVTADAGADTTLVWSSADAAIASVRTDGTVSGIVPGETIVTVSVRAFPALSASRRVRVLAPNVTVAILSAPDSLPIGATAALGVRVTAPAALSRGGQGNGARITTDAAALDSTVSWASRQTAIASVTSDGVVSALAVGAATIVASSTANAERADSVVVVVRRPRVTMVALTPTNFTLEPGDTLTLAAAITAEAGADSALLYSSSAPAIASVDGTGRVTAIAAGGPVTVRVRAASDSTITATATVTVAAPPVSGFVPRFIGVAPYAGRYDVPAMTSIDASRALIGTSNQFSGLSWSASAFFGVLSAPEAVEPICCGEIGGVVATAAISATDAVIATTGTSAFSAGVVPVPQRVFRRRGGAWEDTQYPASTASFGPLLWRLAAVGDHYVAASTTQLVRLDETGWDSLARVNAANTANARVNISGLIAWGGDSIVVAGCRGDNFEDPWIGLRSADSLVMLPVPSPGPCSDRRSDFELAGADVHRMATVSPAGLHQWDGTAWTTTSAGLQADDTLARITRCGDGTLYTSARTNGRVYRLAGSALQRIADNADAAALGRTSPGLEIDCAPDGTLRAGSGEGHVARWTGSTWVRENWAPISEAVSLGSGTVGHAVSRGAVHRWSGSGWTTVFRDVASRFVPADVVTRADGSFVAIGTVRETVFGPADTSAFRPAITASLHGDGGGTFSFQQIGTGDALTVVSLDGGPVFATAGAFLNSTVLRLTGNSWTPEPGLPAGLTALATRGASDAVAIGRGSTYRFNGTTWQALPGLVPPSGGGINSAHIDAGGAVWATNCESTGRHGLWRFRDGAWSVVTPNVPGSNCVRAVASRTPADVWVIVRVFDGGARSVVLRGDGSSWTPVEVPGLGDVTLTDIAVQGDRVVVTGQHGRAYELRLPAASARSVWPMR